MCTIIHRISNRSSVGLVRARVHNPPIVESFNSGRLRLDSANPLYALLWL